MKQKKLTAEERAASIDRGITYLRNVSDWENPVSITLPEMLRAIRDGYCADAIATIRAETDKGKQNKMCREKLPATIVQVHACGIRDWNAIYFTGYLLLNLTYEENERDRLHRFRENMTKLNGDVESDIMAIYTPATQNGIHVIVKMPHFVDGRHWTNRINRNDQAIEAAKRLYANIFSSYAHQLKNWNFVPSRYYEKIMQKTFLSHDPDIYIHGNLLPLVNAAVLDGIEEREIIRRRKAKVHAPRPT
jgi:hypothetical protein